MPISQWFNVLRRSCSLRRGFRRSQRGLGFSVVHHVDVLEARVLLAAVNPYLQNPASDAMTITWFTQSNTPETLTVSVQGGAQVFSGPSSPVLATALAYHANEVPLLPGGVDPGAPYRHSIRVTGLTAGTAYDYTVAQAGGTYASHFRTSPEPMSSVRFIVYADSETEPESTGASVGWTVPSAVPPGSTGRPAGLNNYVVDQTEGYRQNLNLIESRNPDFIGIAGDLVESGGEQRDWDEFWRHNAGNLNDLASSTPILAAPGNHENFGGPGGFGGYTDAAAIRSRDKFKTYFETPDNGSGVSSFEDRYFRVDYGPVTYISLDVSNGLPAGSSQDTNFFLGAAPGFPDFNPGSPQYQWLETQLADAQTKSQFTFVQLHHVPYSVGPHGFPAGNGGNGAGFDTQSGVPVRVLTPLFAQYGVDAVFSGHDEQYQHSLVDGIHFYDIGIGGDGLRGPSSGPDGTTGLPSTNPFQQFLAHLDAPEVWNGNQLVSGGKHYGHLEVDVYLDVDGVWKAELEPVYNFPLMNSSGTITGWERRVYDDAVMLTAPGIEPIGATINGGSNVNRSGIAALTVNFDKPATVGAATDLNLFNHTTGLPINLSNATLLNNGTTSITWVLHDGPAGNPDVSLTDGRYTAELPASATTPNLAQTHSMAFHKLTGDVSGDGTVSFTDYGVVQANFEASGSVFRAGDASGDGTVSFTDYGVVQSNFGASLTATTLDFGDAPDSATFPTTLANNGARHVITGNTLFLGAARDAEANGQPNVSATGDDIAVGDDEDGISIAGGALETQSPVNVSVTVAGTGFLNAWIDYNNDGDWDDVGEHVIDDLSVTTGTPVIPMTAPLGSQGTRIARFRLTATAGYSYFGLASNGEVEDHAITINNLSGPEVPSAPPASSPVPTEARIVMASPAGEPTNPVRRLASPIGRFKKQSLIGNSISGNVNPSQPVSVGALPGSFIGYAFMENNDGPSPSHLQTGFPTETPLSPPILTSAPGNGETKGLLAPQAGLLKLSSRKA